MPLVLAQFIVALVELYTGIGVVFALVFLSRGITVVDHRVDGAPLAMRALLLPGVTALWPLFARRWATGAREPVERNSHRAKAGAA